MQKLLLFLATFVFLSRLACVPAAAASATVSGLVHTEFGQPIAGATIRLQNASVSLLARTDASGFFDLGSVPAGTFLLTVIAVDYQPVQRTLQTSQSAPTTLDIELSPASSGSVVSLGVVRVNGSLAPSHASALTANIDTQALAEVGAPLSDALAEQIGMTMTRPAGGAPGLPQTPSLRGPDPSETVVDIDGHQVNNGNTGDFDLALFDPSEFQSVQLVYGVGPSSLIGADTQGGAVNFQTLDPSPRPMGLVRLSAGSFNSFSATLESSGTSDRFGYAFVLHRFTTAGEVKGQQVLDNATGVPVTIGSDIAATTDLLKLRYALSESGDYLQVVYRNLTAGRDLSAPLATPLNVSDTGSGATFTVIPGARSDTIAPALDFDVHVALERAKRSASPLFLVARHEDAVSSQSVPADVEALGNPYLINARDRVVDDSLELDGASAVASLTIGYDVRRETLRAPAVLAPGPSEQSRSGRSWVARYEWHPNDKLQLTAGSYINRFDTFGTSVDPRLAVVWSPDTRGVLRASVGTAFRAPLLAERVFNPNLKAERTTEFEVGYERRLGPSSNSGLASLSLYRTNLRDPIFFTVNGSGALTFLKNLGHVVYQGAELRVAQPLTRALALDGEYGIDIAYPVDNPFAFDPAAPNVVAGQQFQGIPPHKARLRLRSQPARGLDSFVELAYESDNNELNRPRYVLLNAGVVAHIHRDDIAVFANNLTDQYAQRFTLPNAGVPYPTPLGPAPTNALSLQGTGVTVTITQRY